MNSYTRQRFENFVLTLIYFLAVFFFIDFFGFLNSETQFRIPGVLKGRDVFFILSLLPVFHSFYFKTDISKKINNSPISKMFIAFSILIIAQSIRTFLMGESLTYILRMARILLYYLFFFSTFYYCIRNNNTEIVERLLVFISIIFTTLLILIALFHIDNFIPLNGFKIGKGIYGTTIFIRPYFMGFTFIILGFFLAYYKWMYMGIKKYGIFAVYSFVGVILQGFRAYIIATILIIIFSLVFSKQLKLRWGKKLIIFLIMIVIAFGFLLNKIYSPGLIGGRIYSGIYEVMNKTGNFEGRINSDWFRWQMYRKSPILGVGFIHPNSHLAENLGVEESGDYSLYTTDSGYLDILNKLGVIGAIFFLLFIYLIVKRYSLIIHREKWQKYKPLFASGISFTLLILITQISHAGFTNTYGIIPLSIILGLTEANLTIEQNI